jgi:hypothetical protein
LLIFLLAGTQAAMAAWTTRARDEAGLKPVAVATNKTGQRAEIFLGDQLTIYLRLELGAGFETFAETNCPTFQIDDRKPMHHFEIGGRCAIAAKKATFMLGRIENSEIKSLILHRFMNGNKVTFRYTVNNGQYRQAAFSLRASKQALKNALGFDLRIRVD